MPAKLTRLELVIIVSALVVLVLTNRPPEPGNADVRTDIGQRDTTPSAIPQAQPESVPPERTWTNTLSPQPPVGSTPDNPIVEPVPPRQTKRFGMVDARNCDSLRDKYPNVMYGEITVRWIWNGTKFEPTKVCEVKESNGIVTVWRFDEHQDGVTITPVSEDEVPTN